MRALSARNYKSVPGERKLVSQLQEVAFEALKTKKAPGFISRSKGPWFLELTQTAINCKVNRCRAERNNS